MKIKTTKKFVKNNYRKVISIGYCALQRLLRLEEPAMYTTNCYGWGADIYIFDEVAIVTGYAPFGNIKVEYSICEKYEKMAYEIQHSNLDYNSKKDQLRNLIDNFIDEVQK